MKKFIKLLCLGLALVFISGCESKDSMEDITIYTSIYPIEYITKALYGEHANIVSFYPNDVNPYEYKLTAKQIKDYSSSDLIIYNGLDTEKDYIAGMLNKNKKLKIIDVSMGMTYDNDVAELWLNPYNYLMMAQNTKNGLLEYISNPYLITNDEGTGVEDKYEALKYDLSRLDADIKETISLSSYDTIVVDNDVFNFLSKYNLNVISLEEDDKLTDIKINEVKKDIAKINTVLTERKIAEAKA